MSRSCNVPPVPSQMRRDSVGSGAFADARDRYRVRLRVFGIRHRRIPRLPQRRNVIDVYAEPKCFHRIFNRFQTVPGEGETAHYIVLQQILVKMLVCYHSHFICKVRVPPHPSRFLRTKPTWSWHGALCRVRPARS